MCRHPLRLFSDENLELFRNGVCLLNAEDFVDTYVKVVADENVVPLVLQPPVA